MNETVFERAKYPTNRTVAWMSLTFKKVQDIIKSKGYSDAESVRLAWNLFEDTDWRYYGEGLTIEQRAEQILSVSEYEKQCAETMLKAMNVTASGFGNRHYIMLADTKDRLAVAKALMGLGISPALITGREADEDEDTVFVDVMDYYCPEVGRIVSEKASCLVLVEDCWENCGSMLYVSGREAVLGEDYTAYHRLWNHDDEPNSFDTLYAVRRKDGSIFISDGGSGCVDVNNLEAYLKPFGFDRKEFNEKYGYHTYYAKNPVKKESLGDISFVKRGAMA